MNKDDYEKNMFFKSFNMVSITSVNTVNDLSKKLETEIEIQKSCLSSQSISILEKNNCVLTDYEDLCITNGSLTCYPFKDFDFIGKNVICFKCYQKFASRSSYQVHIGTNICAKPVIIRNPVYMKFKSKHRKKTSELLSDIRVFQTRQKSYTNVMQFTAGDQKKPKNYYYSYKAPKKKLQKNNNNGGEPRKRGRPRKVVREKVSKSIVCSTVTRKNENY